MKSFQMRACLCFSLICLSACQVSVDSLPSRSRNEQTTASAASSSPSTSVSVATNVPVRAVQVIPSRLVIESGKSSKANGNVQYMDNTSDSSLIWSSSDNTIADVDAASGEIRALKPGEVTIVATASRDGQKRAGVQVSVKAAAVQTAYVNVEPTTLTLKARTTSVLSAQAAQGDGGRSPNLSWRSSDSNIAIVQGSGGSATVTAISPGTVTITVQADADGTRSANVTVTVIE